MIEDLKSMVLTRLKDWYNANKKTPDQVLYYRDGVAETQYTKLQETELTWIHEAWDEFLDWLYALKPQLAGVQRPNLSLIAVVVTKRHNTRLFPFNNSDKMQGNENCKPGTLVDQVITSPYFRDFFLQSHNGLLGTAKAAHYFVLHNSANWTDAQIQDLVRAQSLFPIPS